MIPPWLERMGMYSWDIEGFGPILPQTRTPRLTIRWEYPDTLMPPTEVTFCLSPDYGINSAPSRDRLTRHHASPVDSCDLTALCASHAT